MLRTYRLLIVIYLLGGVLPLVRLMIFGGITLPWQTLTVNYVWSSSAEIGDTWPSAYTNKSQMVAVQARNPNQGFGMHERRNVVEDFKQLFDVDVRTLEGYAAMDDGDNTVSSGTAWFSDITF